MKFKDETVSQFQHQNIELRERLQSVEDATKSALNPGAQSLSPPSTPESPDVKPKKSSKPKKSKSKSRKS